MGKPQYFIPTIQIASSGILVIFCCVTISPIKNINPIWHTYFLSKNN